MSDYFLMHKDIIVAALKIDEMGTIEKVSNNINKSYIPLGGKKSPDELKRWWKSRTAFTKDYYKGKFIDISPTQILIKSYGLSLSDSYWIKPVNDSRTWNDVNLYDNNFVDIFGMYSFKKHINIKYPVLSPVASKGDLAKEWIIDENNERCLIKGNNSNSCIQSINEAFASFLHKKQNKQEYTPYYLKKIKVNEYNTIGCICKNFTDKFLEFVPAIDIIQADKKPNDKSTYEFYISQCVKYGMNEKKVRDFLEYQIVTDVILSNTDRHLNNFGILRDTSTLKFIKNAPIFDSGNSMFYDKIRMIDKIDTSNIVVNSFKTNEKAMLKLIKNSNIIDFSKLPTYSEFVDFYKIDEVLDISIIDKMYEKYQSKINIVKERFQEIELNNNLIKIKSKKNDLEL